MREPRPSFSLTAVSVRRITPWLAAGANALTLLTAIGFVVGQVILWRYLDAHGYGSHIMSLLGSPHYLLVAAVAALGAALWLVVLFLVVPHALHMLGWMPGHRRPGSRRGRWVVYFLLSFLPVPLFALALHSLSIGNAMSLAVVFVILCCKAISLRWLHGGFAAVEEVEEAEGTGRARRGRGEYWFEMVFLLLGLFFLLLYVFLVIGKFVIRLSPEGWLQWGYLAVGYGLYCLLIAGPWVQREEGVSHVPLMGAAVILLLIFWVANPSHGIMTTMRLGHYPETLAISDELAQALEGEEGVQPARTGKEGTWLLEDIWVVVRLPDRVVIAPSAGAETRYEIPDEALRPLLRRQERGETEVLWPR